MGNVRDLSINVYAHTSEAISNINGLTKSVETMGKVVATSGNLVKGGINQIFDPLSLAANPLKKFGKELSLKVTLPIGLSSVAAIHFGAVWEQNAIAFKHFLGSAEKAKVFMDELIAFADASPFTRLGVMASAKGLMAYGFALKEVVPMLQNIGDASAALGIGDFGMSRIIRAMGQIKAKGRVQGDELLQLDEAGINGAQMIADYMGVSTAELYKQMQKGAVDAQTAIAGLNKGMKEQFGGMMKAQMGTWTQVMSTFRDQIETILSKFGKGMMTFLKPPLVVLSKILSLITLIPQPIFTIVAAFALIAASIGPIVFILGVVLSLIGTMAVILQVGLRNWMNIARFIVAIAVSLLKALGALKGNVTLSQSMRTVWLSVNESARTFNKNMDQSSKIVRGIHNMLSNLGSKLSGKKINVSTTGATTNVKNLQKNIDKLQADVAKPLTLKVNTAGTTKGVKGAGFATNMFSSGLFGGPMMMGYALADSVGTFFIERVFGNKFVAGFMSKIPILGKLFTKAVVVETAALAGASVGTEVAAASTTKLAAAQTIAAATSKGLAAALAFVGKAAKGLWVFFTTNPFGIALAVILGVIVGLKTLFDWMNKKYEIKLTIATAAVDRALANLQSALGKFGANSKEAMTAAANYDNKMRTQVDAKAAAEKNSFWEVVKNAWAWVNPLAMAAHLSASEHAKNIMTDSEKIQKDFGHIMDHWAKGSVTNAGKAILDDALARQEEIVAKSSGAQLVLEKAKYDKMLAYYDNYLTELDKKTQIAAKGYTDQTINDYIDYKSRMAAGITMIPGMAGPQGELWGSAEAPWTEATYVQAMITQKTKELRDGMKNSQQDLASAGQSLVGTLTEIPKNIDKVLARDWAGISGKIAAAVNAFNSAWVSIDKDTMTAITNRAAAIAAIAGSLGSTLQVLADMPKKVLHPIKQNYTALSNFLNSATDEIMTTLEKYTDEMLTTKSARMENVANVAGSLGTMLQALADMPKKLIRPMMQNWTTLGNYLKTALRQILDVFAKDAGLAKSAERAGSIASVAGSIGTFIQALADMPKKLIHVAPQNWVTLGLAVEDIMTAILAVFESISTKTLEKNATRLGSVGNMASSISSMVTSFMDITGNTVKKALVGIGVVRENATRLATGITSMVAEFMKVIAGSGVKVSEGASGNYDRIFGIVGSISDVITSFSEITTSKINAAIVSLDKTANKAPAIGKAMVKMVEALKKSFTGLRIGESFATLNEQVMSMAASLGDTIKTYAEITEDMISKAVASLKLASKSAPALGAAMRGLVLALKDEFKPLMKDKKFDVFADIADRVTTIASNVAGIITTFAAITKDLIDTAVAGLQEAAKQAPLLGQAMVNLVNALGKQFTKAKVDETLVTLTGQVTGIASQVGNILTQFAELTEDSIDKAIASLNYVSSQAPVLAAALVEMAVSLRDAFADAKVDKAFADSMDIVGRVMDTVSSVFSFATSMTKENVKILQEFADSSTDMYTLWQGVGFALTNAVNGLISALSIIPDAGRLAIAEKAIASLSAIFSSLTGLMDSVGKAKSWTVDMRNPVVEAAVMGTGAGVGVVPQITANTRFPSASPVVTPTAGGQKERMDIHIDVSWQTWDGKPSNSEIRRVANHIEPELRRVANNINRGGF